MFKKSLSAIGLSLLITAGHASAATMSTWTFEGSISNVVGPYVLNGETQTPTELAASEAALASFSLGSHYIAQFSIDLDSLNTPSSGSASFEGAIKSFNFFIPDTGFSYSSTNTVNSGVSITPDIPSGDLIYFYLPSSISVSSSDTTMLASFFFTDPNGSLNTSQNLHDLSSAFDINNYLSREGHAYINNYDCYYGNCGSATFSIESATVSTVPLPGAAILLSSGLLGLLPLVRKRTK